VGLGLVELALHFFFLHDDLLGRCHSENVTRCVTNAR
jgi:hypothetical protein